MFDYIKTPYSKKLDELIEAFPSSAKLSDELGVSRQSLVNWRDKDFDETKIKEENRLKIDIIYCKTFGFERISAEEIDLLYKELNDIDFSYFQLDEEDLVATVSRFNAFGSLEIEESNITQKQFNSVVIDKEMIKDIEQREFFSIKNHAALNHKVIKEALRCKNTKDCTFTIDTREIKNYHFGLMNGIREDAGEYSTKIRIIPGSEELTLTDPRDIAEELEYWVKKYPYTKMTLRDMAEAHAHFELIHPFGDGNGRVGRIIMALHAIFASYIPPLINKSNKALYYVFLKHAQITNEYSYLAYFIGKSIIAMNKKFNRKKG